MLRHRSIVPLALVTLLGCATRTPGAQPHDMGVASHETHAAQEAELASAHGGRYDPNAEKSRTKCTANPRAGDIAGADACWTSTTNPTAVHREHAEDHRRRAADHRAASQALRDAEGRACTGIPDADRDQSPFDHREDIASVEPLYSTPSGKLLVRHMEGAVVTFRAVPGMTAQLAYPRRRQWSSAPARAPRQA